ncbi:hypothetical protein [Paenibacillus caui]|uniref:hypothetical protein n=1 Tax=Paenibacillus caui TaxID=2873927 RepID=UPI001CA8C75B|nr:hypothetical protein [Paenibacillus caui]
MPKRKIITPDLDLDWIDDRPVIRFLKDGRTVNYVYGPNGEVTEIIIDDLEEENEEE